ncbi:MAG: hypothetical protein ABI835_20190 [Chloroflexota bacterium]
MRQQPPEIRRRISMYPLQIIGMSLIALIPLVALVGVFGERQAAVESSSAAFTLQAEYPDLFRFKTENNLIVKVRNRTDQGWCLSFFPACATLTQSNEI